MSNREHVIVNKTLDLGKVDGYGNGRKVCRLTLELNILSGYGHGKKLTIDLTPTDEPYRKVSIVGDVWNSSETDIIMGGQMQDEILDYVDTKQTRRIVELWDRWHLNDMKAGTRLQQECLATYGKDERYDYDVACKRLADNNLLIDRGYKYGSAWLVEIVPTDVLRELCQLFGADDSVL